MQRDKCLIDASDSFKLSVDDLKQSFNQETIEKAKDEVRKNTNRRSYILGKKLVQLRNEKRRMETDGAIFTRSNGSRRIFGMKYIKDNFKIPVLAKDFFIDPYQVALSKSYGCDCILIIIAALDKKLADEIYAEALKKLNKDTLTNVVSSKKSLTQRHRI